MINIQNKLTQKAFAKINLILKVLNKRPDNYHNIFTLMHKISLHDAITILPNDNELYVECDVDLNIPMEENIVYKTAKALLEYTNCERSASIIIKKNIPIGAGLGGGSSDAATTLLLLNQFWELKLSMGSLYKIAITLGSDVPFFLENYPKWIYGKGEHCKILDIIEMDNRSKIKYKHIDANAIVVYPKIHINTSEAYQKLNRTIEDIEVNYDSYLKRMMWVENEIDNNTNKFLRHKMVNDFESVIFESYPEIEDIHKTLSSVSNGGARLTGSGSAVFALFIDKNKDVTMNYVKSQLKQKFKEEGKDYLVFRTTLVP